MGRPARENDDELAARLRAYKEANSLSLSKLGVMLAADKSTIARSLTTGSFSEIMSRRVRSLVGGPRTGSTPSDLLRESLRILRLSDSLRRQAEERLVEALDRTVRDQ